MKSKKSTKTKKNPKSKSQSKRLKTFNSSDFSLVDDRHQLSSYEPNQILKKQVLGLRRNHIHSALSQYQAVNKSSKTNLNKSTTNIIQKKKKNASSRLQKSKQKKEQPYETIKYEEISSNSQIVFSHEETKRTSSVGQDSQKYHSLIQVQDVYAVDANKMLKISIRREYHRRIEAAVKIQKVFRGFMTRKILAKYLTNVEEEIIQLQKRSVKVESEDFSEEEITPQEGTERTFKQVFPVAKFNLESEKLNHAHRPRIQFNEEEISDSEKKSEESFDFQNQEIESSESEPLGYRHKQPIYSHEGISKFLDQSSENSAEEEDHFQPDIIFETNQEYLESRKSSMQNKNQPTNKLSKPNIKEELIINEENQTNREVQKEESEENLLQIAKEEVQQLQIQEQKKSEKKFEQNQNLDSSFRYQEENEFSISHEDVLKLRKEEKQKWDEVISMVTGQLSKNKESSSEAVNVMKKILEMSQKNKQFLDSTQSANLEGTSQITVPAFLNKNAQAEENSHSVENEHRLFKKKKLEIDIAEKEAPVFVKKYKKEEVTEMLSSEDVDAQTCPIPRKQNFHTELERKIRERQTFSPLFENKGKIKKFISSNLQDDTVYDMLKIRQELLEKRESEQLSNLNRQLGCRALTQEQFLEKLENLTKRFKTEKNAIDKAKQDIQKGYKAAMNLIKESFFDAKRLGFKLSMSRSQDNIKYKNPKLLMNEIIVDEITPKSTKKSFKNIFLDEEDKSRHEDSENENSSVDFTQQELHRFRKLQTHELEINQLNKNVLISDDFFRQQQNQVELNLEQPQREVYHFEEEFKEQKEENNDLYQIIDRQIELLMWEAAAEITILPNIAQKLIDRTKNMRPSSIKVSERHQFLEMLYKNLPSQQILQQKLNQKITPLPSEILKCMRLDFSQEADDEQQEGYEQISKYEFVISQDICMQTVMEFKEQIFRQKNSQRKEKQEIKNEYILEVLEEGSYGEILKKSLLQRQKFIQNRKQHSKDLFWQVMNIEIHCIFDAWNQQIIQLRSQKAGFSGIGLNELTLSLLDHNKHVEQKKVQNIINQAKEAVKETIDPQTEVNAKILKENFKQMCYNDSAWIFYADQALSYGLQIVYLIEEEIYKETEKELRKIIMKKTFI